MEKVDKVMTQDTGNKRLIGGIIHEITQLASLFLAFVWFGWQGGVIVFLMSWSINTLEDRLV